MVLRGSRGSSAVILCGLLAALLTGCPDSGGASEGTSQVTTPEERGKKLYLQHCSVCHGVDGKGDGPGAYLLHPRPRDFTAGRYRLASTENNVPTDDDLMATLNRGMPGSSMPSWAHLPRRDRKALITYIKSFGEYVFKEREPGEPVEIGEEPPNTVENRILGRRIYQKSCAPCHGPDGEGDGAQKQVTTEGYPIRPNDYTRGIFKGGSDGRSLFTRIRTGMLGTPMPSYDRESLSDDQVWHIVHYIQSLAPPEAEERVLLTRKTIPVEKVRDEPLPETAKDEAWTAVEPVYVALTPLWWRDSRIEGLLVQAVHDGDELALRISWRDKTKGDGIVKQQAFRDGAALQLTRGENESFFGMGRPGGPVNIWHWKADWETDTADRQDLESRYPGMTADRYPFSDIEPGELMDLKAGKGDVTRQEELFLTGAAAGNPYSEATRTRSVENLEAEGQGTLTSLKNSQPVRGRGIWADGTWRVVFRRKLKTTKTEGNVQLEPGKTISIAFAVWDGDVGDRNGQKSVSIWHDLDLDR